MGDHRAGWPAPSPSPQASLDYSQPITSLLKIGTVDVHAAAHHSEGAIRLVNGTLPKSRYVLYLYMLWHVYSVFEELLENHSDSSTLGGFAHPRVSGRSLHLADDIDHILGHQVWRSTPPELSPTMTKALENYLGRLIVLGQNFPDLLLAHVYVRILGDLSGGQYIKRQVQKAYQLEEESLSFYRFGKSQEDIGKTKLWFKNTMNEAVPQHGFDLKARLVAEARMAFIMNVGLLESLVSPLPV